MPSAELIRLREFSRGFELTWLSMLGRSTERPPALRATSVLEGVESGVNASIEAERRRSAEVWNFILRTVLRIWGCFVFIIVQSFMIISGDFVRVAK